MYKKIYLSVLLTILIISCSTSKFKNDGNGLEYYIVESHPQNRIANPGEIMEVSMYYTDEKDSILYDTREFPNVFKMKIKAPSPNGGTIDDGILLMHEGDSAIFKVDAIRFYTETKNEQVPQFIKSGDKLIFYIKILKIYSLDEYLANKKKQYNFSEQEEINALKNYLKLSNITVEPTPSGLYYIETKKGSGKKPNDSSIVKIDYLASFLGGKIFDNTYERNEPFEFQLGKNIVIPGLEEGVKLMREGGEATLIIPSKLAYGSQQYKIVPPFTTIIFEVKLLSVK